MSKHEWEKAAKKAPERATIFRHWSEKWDGIRIKPLYTAPRTSLKGSGGRLIRPMHAEKKTKTGGESTPTPGVRTPLCTPSGAWTIPGSMPVFLLQRKATPLPAKHCRPGPKRSDVPLNLATHRGYDSDQSPGYRDVEKPVLPSIPLKT